MGGIDSGQSALLARVGVKNMCELRHRYRSQIGSYVNLRAHALWLPVQCAYAGKLK